MPLNDNEVLLGMLNDNDREEFDNSIEDEDLSIYPPPGVEIGTLDLRIDQGSGSFAQDGRLEVAEDKLMMDGETQLGSAAMFGPTEIGEDDLGANPAAMDGQSEIGLDLDAAHVALEQLQAALVDDPLIARKKRGRSFGSGHGGGGGGMKRGRSFGSGHGGGGRGMSEFRSAVGYNPAALEGASEIGAHDGLASTHGQSEIGHIAGPAALSGQSEIGAHADVMAPFESFMLDDIHVGAADRGYGEEIGAAEAADRPGSEIGYVDDVGAGYAPMEGQSEIGAAAAVVKVIEKARDNRQPPPPMRAVDVDAPSSDDGIDDDMTDMFIGVSAATGNPDPFPLTTQFLQRCGAGMEPRFVRVDTEASYKQFRTENSPELAELREKLEAHTADPQAHTSGGEDLSDELSDDIDDLVHLGAEVEAAENEKRLELWMPTHFDGFVEAWREGDSVGASMILPDGRIATSLESIAKSVAEMSRHAAEADVPTSTVVGVLSAMGCVLGAGTVLKEMAAAAPSIVQRPQSAPFMVRIEPKTSPALCALAMLVMACRAGVAQACDEWQNLGALAPAPVRQAMIEAVQLAKAAA